ncbi:cytochrome c oxidase subunit II [Demequina sp. SO4-13]|uniref:cytochrome c oxidase subunit II n=1 Tax=Demequina sp. SO4-13 TaxID=3401027 RepID=UPI003AF761A5
MSVPSITARTLACAALLGLAAGCSTDTSEQSALAPAGSQSQAVHELWVWMAVVGAVVWAIVVVLMFVALARRGHGEADATAEDSAGRRAAMTGRPVAAVAVAGALIPAIIVGVIAVMAISVQRETDHSAEGGAPIAEVVGHQFWWEVSYPDHDVTSANEIHIPVGERVRIELSSADVIHSLWVPELGGKVDMIPGRSNPLWLEADEPGVYWGQCAEYCGAQHARMRFVVVAHEQAELDAWLRDRDEGSDEVSDEVPTSELEGDALVERGREVFMSSSCVYCHAVQGTAATGQTAPDLTHVGSRLGLAAGILPNDTESLTAWITDPQSIKPGSLMPGTDFDDPSEVDAIVAYLESLE